MSNDFDEQALRPFCAEHLARFKIPARIEPIDEIPRTGSGKTIHHKLPALTDQHARDAHSAPAGAR